MSWDLGSREESDISRKDRKELALCCAPGEKEN